jgi:hypothetical protein
MKKNYKSCIVGSLVTTAALLIGSSAFALHTEPIPLLDAAGNPVTVGGAADKVAYSAKATCGACHDYNKIERHSFHAQLGANEHKGWNPWKYGNMNSIASKGKPWVQATGHVGKW